jgi:hypothetical protein
MPNKPFSAPDNANSNSHFVSRSFAPRTFPVPSEACNRQRGLFQNTATPVGAGLVLNEKNQAPWTKDAFPACKR